MSEADWERTAVAVRAALDAGELTALVPLLAPGVRWHGAGPGGCHAREHVVAWIDRLVESGTGFRLVALQRVADRIALRLAATSGGEVHQLVALDADGLITHVIGHDDAASAERDLVPAPSGAPVVPVARSVPFVQVADVEAAIAFYALLGFAVAAEHRPEGRRVWASLRAQTAELMVAETEEPVDPAAQGVLFYLYTADLDGVRRHLRAHGHVAGPIADGSPGPRREMRVDDPDGYCLMIAETD